MSGIVRLAARIDASDLTVKPVTVTAPLRMVRITSDDVADPVSVAMQFTKLHEALDKATLPARSHPMQAPMVFDKIATTYNGTWEANHNLGHVAGWQVTKFAPSWSKWAASAVYAVGAYVRPRSNTTVGAPSFFWRCTTAGTTGAGEPAWNRVVGSTTADNTAVWTNQGPPIQPQEDSSTTTNLVLRFFAPGTAEVWVF